MAREALVSQEMVNKAADELVAAGKKVVVRDVREALGNQGSMATITKLLQVWRAGQVRQSQVIDDTVTPAVINSINSMVAEKVQAATAEANSKIVDLQENLNGVIAESERQATDLEAQANELAELQAMTQVQGGQIAQLTTEGDRLREQVAAELHTRETVQIELAQAQLQLKGLPQLQADLKAAQEEATRAAEERGTMRERIQHLEISLDAEQKARTEADTERLQLAKTVATLTAELVAERARSADATARAAEAEKREKEAQIGSVAAQRETAQAKGQVDALLQQIEDMKRSTDKLQEKYADLKSSMEKKETTK
jgi:colicin import membrane protein